MNVEAGSKDNVPPDQLTGLLHLLAKYRITDDPGRFGNIPEDFVESLDAAHYDTLLNVGQFGKFGEGLEKYEMKYRAIVVGMWYDGNDDDVVNKTVKITYLFILIITTKLCQSIIYLRQQNFSNGKKRKRS